MGELGTSPEVSDEMSPSRSFWSSSGSGSGSTCRVDEALDASPVFWRFEGGNMGSSATVESSKSFPGSGESESNELIEEDRSESARRTMMPMVIPMAMPMAVTDYVLRTLGSYHELRQRGKTPREGVAYYRVLYQVY